MADYLVTIKTTVTTVYLVKNSPNAVTAGTRANTWDGYRDDVERVSTSSDMTIHTEQDI